MPPTREEEVGITCWANTAEGFSSILKQRYADFQVNEIDADGNIVRLTDKGAIRENGFKRPRVNEDSGRAPPGRNPKFADRRQGSVPREGSSACRDPLADAVARLKQTHRLGGTPNAEEVVPNADVRTPKADKAAPLSSATPGPGQTSLPVSVDRNGVASVEQTAKPADADTVMEDSPREPVGVSPRAETLPPKLAHKLSQPSPGAPRADTVIDESAREPVTPSPRCGGVPPKLAHKLSQPSTCGPHGMVKEETPPEPVGVSPRGSAGPPKLALKFSQFSACPAVSDTVMAETAGESVGGSPKECCVPPKLAHKLKSRQERLSIGAPESSAEGGAGLVNAIADTSADATAEPSAAADASSADAITADAGVGGAAAEGALSEDIKDAMVDFQPLLAEFEALAGSADRARLEEMLPKVLQHKKDAADGKTPTFVDPILLEPTSNKEMRSSLHAFFKRKELDGFQTSTVVADPSKDGQKAGLDLPIRVSFRYKVAGGKRKNRDKDKGGSEGWSQYQAWPGGSAEFCRFVMYKENMDSHAALSIIERLLNAKKSMLQIAGTKDKRGVTSQHVTVFKVPPERLVALNRGLRHIWIGNYEFVDSQLWLGALSGNHFRVIMREVTGTTPTGVATAVEALQKSGFINYFGLQRFGHASMPTHKVGGMLLKGDWEAAVWGLLGAREEVIGQENADVCAARKLFSDGDLQGALRQMPRYMVAERALLEGLTRHGKKAYAQALKAIPRHMRQLFTHGYQSYLWNLAASHRATTYGLEKAVAGDLVLLPATGNGTAHAQPNGQDREVEEAEPSSEKGAVHVVTAEEAEAGTYAITDVVLPQPGHSVEYPRHATGQLYHVVAAMDGISLVDAPHKEKDFSLHHLSGAYRYLVQRPKDLTWRLLSYSDPNEDLAGTDLDLAAGKLGPNVSVVEEGSEVPPGKRVALELSFSLPSSTYATMLLRELTKTSTSKEHAKSLTAAVDAAQADAAG